MKSLFYFNAPSDEQVWVEDDQKGFNQLNICISALRPGQVHVPAGQFLVDFP